MRGAGGSGSEVVKREVAVGDSVDRVRHGLVEAELARDELPVGVEVHARQRPGAKRQARALALGEGKALAVARQHPEVGEQMVAEVDGLGALQMGVAGHSPVDVLLGALDQRRHQPRQSPPAPRARARGYT